MVEASSAEGLGEIIGIFSTGGTAKCYGVSKLREWLKSLGLSQQQGDGNHWDLPG